MPEEAEKAEMAALIVWLGMRKKTNNPAVLLLGARAGGLFRSRTFYEILRPFSKFTFNDLLQTQQFGECYHLLSQRQFSESDRDSILADALRNITLTDTDICLAEIVKNKLFNIVISTNLDDLLEEACAQVEMREFFDYEVFIPEHTHSEENAALQRALFCQIIRAFGTLSSRRYSVIERGAYLDRNLKLKNLLEGHLARDVLAVGFDPVWDEEIMRMFPSHGGTIWFVNEEEWAPSHAILHLARARQIKYLVGNEGSYENFWKAVYWHLHENMPFNFRLAQDIIRQLQVLSHDMQFLKENQQNIRNDLKEILTAFQTTREEHLSTCNKQQKSE